GGTAVRSVPPAIAVLRADPALQKVRPAIAHVARLPAHAPKQYAVADRRKAPLGIDWRRSPDAAPLSSEKRCPDAPNAWDSQDPGAGRKRYSERPSDAGTRRNAETHIPAHVAGVTGLHPGYCQTRHRHPGGRDRRWAS